MPTTFRALAVLALAFSGATPAAIQFTAVTDALLRDPAPALATAPSVRENVA